MTYQQKFKLLVIGFVVGWIIILYVSIWPTVNLYTKNQDLNKRLSVTSQTKTEDQILSEHRQVRYISNFLQSDSTSLQNKALDLVANYCSNHQTVLTRFPQISIRNADGYAVNTCIFSVQGPFSDLLRLIYELEQKNSIGKVRSVDFCTSNDVISRKRKLSATIYIQTIQSLP